MKRRMGFTKMCTPWRFFPNPSAHGERWWGAKKPYGEVPCGLDSPKRGSYLVALPPTPNSLGGWQVVHKGAGGSDSANHYVILGVTLYPQHSEFQKSFLNY